MASETRSVAIAE